MNLLPVRQSGTPGVLNPVAEAAVMTVDLCRQNPDLYLDCGHNPRALIVYMAALVDELRAMQALVDGLRAMQGEVWGGT